MILPPRYVAAGTATTVRSDKGTYSTWPMSSLPDYDSEGWSSLIGIITAIIGNILISFALNMQRYAHIRLEREWQEKEAQRKKRVASFRDGPESGSEQSAKKKSSKKYHAPRHTDHTVQNGREGLDEGVIATEADPLLGAKSTARSHTNSRPRLQSTDTSSSDGEEAEEAYKQKSYLKSAWWWAGIILMTTGEAGNFLAYGFAPASIVSPLGVVALISNCMIAPIMLKERFRKRDGFGVLVAVAGAVTVVLSASDNNPKLGPDEIWDLIKRWEFETYLGITVAVIVALTVASDKFGDKSILIDLGLVGLFGGFTALSTKGVASLLSYTLWRAITFPVTYLLVAILVFTAIMQIKYVNRALQRFDATQVIPVQFVMFTLSVILGSAILYRDFERTSGDDAGKFVGGCAMTFAGVWLITSGRHQRHDEDEEDREPESEDSIYLVSGDGYQDDIDEDDRTFSRRSSTIRTSSPTLLINKHQSNARPKFTKQYSFQQSTRTLPIADTPSPMTVNPGEQEPQLDMDTPSVRRAPTPLSRHSTPLLPSEATATPPAASSSNPELPIHHQGPPAPRTPTRGISDNALQITPGTSGTLHPRLRHVGTAERLGARNSIPGPLLASPLSNSLSAMVADLKRGGSLRGQSTLRERDSDRRRESVLGIGASEVNESEFGEPLDRRRTATDDVPSIARQRSLSGTLGHLWRGMRGAGAANDEESPAEARPRDDNNEEEAER